MNLLVHLQYMYGQLMPHELSEREDAAKRTVYHPHGPIVSVYALVEEIFEFYDISVRPISQAQAINIAYVIYT